MVFIFLTTFCACVPLSISQQGFFGGGGLKIHIDLHADPHRVAAGEVVPLDHIPSWKTGKNPFASLPKKAFDNGPQPPPPPTMQMQQPNQWYGGNSDTGSTPLTGANGMMEGGGNNGVVVYAYGDGQDVQGVVHLILPPGKSYDHLGIKVQLLGRITMVCGVCVCMCVCHLLEQEGS